MNTTLTFLGSSGSVSPVTLWRLRDGADTGDQNQSDVARHDPLRVWRVREKRRSI